MFYLCSHVVRADHVRDAVRAGGLRLSAGGGVRGTGRGRDGLGAQAGAVPALRPLLLGLPDFGRARPAPAPGSAPRWRGGRTSWNRPPLRTRAGRTGPRRTRGSRTRADGIRPRPRDRAGQPACPAQDPERRRGRGGRPSRPAAGRASHPARAAGPDRRHGGERSPKPARLQVARFGRRPRKQSRKRRQRPARPAGGFRRGRPRPTTGWVFALAVPRRPSTGPPP